MQKDKAEPQYRAPALDKGLDIIELLARHPFGMSRTEIVKEMGRSPSEIYRMMERLVSREYICRSIHGDRYSLTMKLFLLANEYPPHRRLVDQALPLMDQFADKTQQSVHLVTLDRGKIIVIARASSNANWEFSLKIGAQLDLIDTASGKTFLAFQSIARRRELLAHSRKNCSTSNLDLSFLEKELNDIRAMGCRSAASTQLIGVSDISVPVLSSNGEAFSVLTCPHIERVNPEEIINRETALKELQTIAQKLSIRGSAHN